MAKFNPMEFAARDEGREKADAEGRMWFVLDPDAFYPAAIEQIRRGGVRADAHLLSHARDINGLNGSTGWDLALKPKSEVADADLPLRARCLELARLWFTAVLHRAVQDEHVDRGIGVKISKSERWRL